MKRCWGEWLRRSELYGRYVPFVLSRPASSLFIHFCPGLPQGIHSGRIDGVFGVLRRILPLLLAGLLLASCSINPFAKTSSAPLPLLCRSIPSLSTLTVVRTAPLPQNHLKFTFPADVTVSNQTQVQTVAKALCALPVVRTHGSMSCPSDNGIRYLLTFSNNDQAFPVVTLGGPCGFIQGLIKGQWTYQSPGFCLSEDFGGIVIAVSPGSHCRAH